MLEVQEVAALLQIFEKAAAHGGALDHIKNQALLRLKKINEEAGKADEAAKAHAVEGRDEGHKREGFGRRG